MIVFSFVAISTLDENEKALYYDGKEGVLCLFGNSFAPSQKFLSATTALFEFNSGFLGKQGNTAIEKVFEFSTDYVKDVFSLLYGVFNVFFKNSV